MSRMLGPSTLQVPWVDLVPPCASSPIDSEVGILILGAICRRISAEPTKAPPEDGSTFPSFPHNPAQRIYFQLTALYHFQQLVDSREQDVAASGHCGAPINAGARRMNSVTLLGLFSTLYATIPTTR